MPEPYTLPTFETSPRIVDRLIVRSEDHFESPIVRKLHEIEKSVLTVPVPTFSPLSSSVSKRFLATIFAAPRTSKPSRQQVQRRLFSFSESSLLLLSAAACRHQQGALWTRVHPYRASRPIFEIVRFPYPGDPMHHSLCGEGRRRLLKTANPRGPQG